MQIQISVDSKNFEGSINNLVKNLDFRKPLEKSLEALEIETQQNFNQQGRIYGTWKPLATSTRKQRIRLGYGAARPILERTGKLRKSFKGKVKNDKQAIFENTYEIAKYHQYGTRKMPQRKILDISSKFVGAAWRLFNGHIAETIRKYYG